MNTTNVNHKQRLWTAARAYYDRDLAVLPIAMAGYQYMNRNDELIICDGKQPLVPGWQTRRLDWAELARQLRWQYIVGIGIVTGTLSGNLALLDFDGDGWCGAFDHVMSCWPDFARAPIVITGSGKRHIWLRIPDYPTDVTHLEHHLPALNCAVDLRGNRCQTLAPPSLHPDGGLYEWATASADLPTVEYATLTQWLGAWAGPPVNDDRRGPAARVPDGPVTPGTRHTTLLSWAGSMRERGMSEGAILAALLYENETRCTPPKSEEEVKQIVAFVAGKPAGPPRRGNWRRDYADRVAALMAAEGCGNELRA